MRKGKMTWRGPLQVPNASVLPPCISPTPGGPEGVGLGAEEWGTERDAGRGLTCGQGWTPEGQEKQQPSLGHGPPKRRQDTAADLRCGLGEEAPTRLPPRPQAQLHLSCSTTEPFPSRGAPPTPPRPPNPILSHGVRKLRVPLPQQELHGHTPSRQKSASQFAKPFPSHRPCHPQDTKHEVVCQGLNT